MMRFCRRMPVQSPIRPPRPRRRRYRRIRPPPRAIRRRPPPHRSPTKMTGFLGHARCRARSRPTSQPPASHSIWNQHLPESEAGNRQERLSSCSRPPLAFAVESEGFDRDTPRHARQGRSPLLEQVKPQTRTSGRAVQRPPWCPWFPRGPRTPAHLSNPCCLPSGNSGAC